MNRTLKISLVCVGIFAAGAATGVFGTQRYDDMKREARRAKAESFGPSQMRRFAGALDLTPEQQAGIQPILDDTAGELRKLRRESYRAGAALIAGMEARMSELLTPEQRQRLAVMQAEQRERIRQRFGDPSRRSDPANREHRQPPPPPHEEGL
ncbi:MAG: hypothetical protein ABII82_03940 [Verrucomicrobiota bacterium]